MNFHNVKTVSQIKDLVRMGYDIDKKNNVDQTALHKMVQKDKLELVCGLLDCGASANIVNTQGNVPLFYAKSEAVANCLIPKTHFPYSKNKMGRNLLDSNSIVEACFLKFINK